MAQVELIMPKMGESVAEATIIKWLKKEGDKIAADETVLEIATDKVDSEIPSTAEGTLIKRLYNEGDVVQVGKEIAIISTDTNTVVEAPEVKTPAVTQTTTVQKELAIAAVTDSLQIPKNSSSGKFF